MENRRGRNNLSVAVIGGAVVALILVIGTFWMGRSASRDTASAVHSVSRLYLDELTGRREQVVEGNLEARSR